MKENIENVYPHVHF